MAAARLADSDTMRRLAELSRSREDPAPDDEALAYLAEDGQHIGVVVRGEGDPNVPSLVRKDARTWVVWLLQLRGDDGRFLVVGVSRLGELAELEDVEVTDEVAETALEFARERHPDVEFEIQRAKGLRLVSLVSGEPGLCVRCRTNEPAVSEGNLLLAPEGPVCAGCLNLTEQLAWGEAALAALRRAGGSDAQIAEMERELEDLRAEAHGGP
jgi:hypothetical protein